MAFARQFQELLDHSPDYATLLQNKKIQDTEVPGYVLHFAMNWFPNKVLSLASRNNVVCQNERGWNAIHMAAYKGQIEWVHRFTTLLGRAPRLDDFTLAMLMNDSSALQAWLQKTEETNLRHWLTISYPGRLSHAAQLLYRDCGKVLAIFLRDFPASRQEFLDPSVLCKITSSTTLTQLKPSSSELNAALLAAFHSVTGISQVSILFQAGARFKSQGHFSRETNCFIHECCKNWRVFVARGNFCSLFIKKRQDRRRRPFFSWPILKSVRQLTQRNRRPSYDEILSVPLFFRLYVVIWVVTEHLCRFLPRSLATSVVNFLPHDELIDALAR